MRHDASESIPPPGALVVVEGEVGVWRVERHVVTGDAVACRCFSYVDGRLVVVPAARVQPCPDGTPAAP